MQSVLLVLRLGLAAVFLVAAFAKLADLAGSRAALRAFGVPARLSGPVGVLLPLAELAVALALVPAASAWWGAIGALVLLLVFVAGIGYNLAHGRTPECHCFGQLHSAPAGPSTLVRNLVLAALAGVVIVFGRTTAGLDLGSWWGTLPVAGQSELIGGLLELAVLAGILWLLWHILRQQGQLVLRIEAAESRLAEAGLAQEAGSVGSAGLAVGTSAPPFRLESVQGETLTLIDLLARGLPVLLLFADPGCGPCAALLPEVGSWQRDHAGKLTLAVISRGSRQANQSKIVAQGITRVLLQRDREVQSSYQVTGTPSAVLIGADGTIGSPLAEGADAIRRLVASVVAPPVLRTLPMVPTPVESNGHGGRAAKSPPLGPVLGERAPEFSLPDLEGSVVRLSDFRGSPTLLLFWRPSCGFCQRMLNELQTWEAQAQEGALKLLVVSTGSVQENQAMDLRSPVVLDAAGLSIGIQFGARGTPMAVLIDAQGKIASEVVAGGKAVLALAGATTVPSV